MNAKHKELVAKMEEAKDAMLEKFTKKEISYEVFCHHWDLIDDAQRRITGEPKIKGPITIDYMNPKWQAEVVELAS